MGDSYVVQAQYEYRTAADSHLQYHCAQEQRVMQPFMWLNCSPTGYKGGVRSNKIF